MKNRTQNLVVALFLIVNFFYVNIAVAQKGASKPSIALLELDTDGMNQDVSLLTDLCRTNLYQLGQFVVMDKYDVDYVLKNKDIDLDGCYGSICLADVGKILKVDKMLSGNIQRFPKKFTIRLRLIDVNNQIVEKDQVMDFLKLETQIGEMFEVSLKKMFDMPLDENLVEALTKENNFENAINTPTQRTLSLSGPRAGFVVIMGEEGKVLRDARSVGGFDSRSVTFQFGYQFEKTYLNSGKIQALFEVIPIITGVDQGRFIPSITFLNGIRNNKSGFEFAFGPMLYLTQKKEGFYREGSWHLKQDQINYPNEKLEFETRIDSRGTTSVDAGLVFAVGRTFKSGSINFPLNVFVTVKKKDYRMGISVGYNAVK